MKIRDLRVYKLGLGQVEEIARICVFVVKALEVIHTIGITIEPLVAAILIKYL